MSERKKTAVWPWIVGAIAVPVLYVLSFGPITYVLMRAIAFNYGPPNFAARVYYRAYEPIFWAGRNSSAVGQIVERYRYFWISAAR